MTPSGRLIFAIVACVCSMILGVAALIADPSNSSALLVPVGTIGTTLGYVFGDRNGEKRLAAALTELDAETRRAERAEPPDAS